MLLIHGRNERLSIAVLLSIIPKLRMITAIYHVFDGCFRQISVSFFQLFHVQHMIFRAVDRYYGKAIAQFFR